MCTALGRPCDIPNHASYVQSWLHKLRHDKREIFRAAAAAQRIADYCLAFPSATHLGKARSAGSSSRFAASAALPPNARAASSPSACPLLPDRMRNGCTSKAFRSVPSLATWRCRATRCGTGRGAGSPSCTGRGCTRSTLGGECWTALGRGLPQRRPALAEAARCGVQRRDARRHGIGQPAAAGVTGRAKLGLLRARLVRAA